MMCVGTRKTPVVEVVVVVGVVVVEDLVVVGFVSEENFVVGFLYEFVVNFLNFVFVDFVVFEENVVLVVVGLLALG